MNVKSNLGTIDRAIRTGVGIVLVLWALAGGPGWAWLGLVLLATAAFSWCPLYRLLGLNTRERPGGPGTTGTGAPNH